MSFDYLNDGLRKIQPSSKLTALGGYPWASNACYRGGKGFTLQFSVPWQGQSPHICLRSSMDNSSIRVMIGSLLSRNAERTGVQDYKSNKNPLAKLPEGSERFLLG